MPLSTLFGFPVDALQHHFQDMIDLEGSKRMIKQGGDNKDDTRWTTHLSKEIVYLVADLVKTFHSSTNNTLKNPFSAESIITLLSQATNLIIVCQTI